jgi:hypothetical protein
MAIGGGSEPYLSREFAMEFNQQLVIGNAAEEAQTGSRRGWFVGQFMAPDDGLKQTQDVEVKWGIHAAGEQKSLYGTNAQATTLSILISGSFVLNFPDFNKSVQLQQPGDYVLWAPGIAHSWQAPETAVVVTVRWPSIANDQGQRPN